MLAIFFVALFPLFKGYSSFKKTAKEFFAYAFKNISNKSHFDVKHNVKKKGEHEKFFSR
jgi:hypothetical protein